jgi:hypothetical protein
MRLTTDATALPVASLMVAVTALTPAPTVSAAGSGLGRLPGRAQPPSASTDPAMDCDDLAAQDFSTLLDAWLRITSATDIETTGTDPAHCQIEGLVGSNAQVVLQCPSSA